MEENTHIYFKRSGGFTGRILETRVNIATLPSHEALQLKQMINSSGIETMRNPYSSNAQPDAFSYSIVMGHTGQDQHIEFTDSQVTPNLKPLLNYLIGKARKP